MPSCASSASGSTKGSHCFFGSKQDIGGWEPLASTSEEKDQQRSLKFFEQELDATEKALRAARKQVGQQGSCDIALFRDAKAIRLAAEVMLERSILAKRGAANAGKAMAKAYGKSGGGSQSVQNPVTPLVSEELCRDNDPEAERKSDAANDSRGFDSLMESSSNSCGATPWFDLVRHVPAVSVKDICHSKVDLQDIVGHLEPIDAAPIPALGPPPRSPTPMRTPTPGLPRCVSRSRQVQTPPVGPAAAAPALIRLRLELELGDVVMVKHAPDCESAVSSSSHTHVTDLTATPAQQIELRFGQDDVVSSAFHRFNLFDGEAQPRGGMTPIGSVIMEIADAQQSSLSLSLISCNRFCEAVTPLRVPATKLLEQCQDAGTDAAAVGPLELFLTWMSAVDGSQSDNICLTHYYPFRMRITMIAGTLRSPSPGLDKIPVIGPGLSGQSPMPDGGCGTRGPRPPRCATPGNIAARVVVRNNGTRRMKMPPAFPRHWEESRAAKQQSRSDSRQGHWPRPRSRAAVSTPRAQATAASTVGDDVVPALPALQDECGIDKCTVAQRKGGAEKGSYFVDPSDV